MKVLYSNLVSGVTSSASTDSNFPTTNLYDNIYPKKIWRADSATSSTLTVSTSASATAIAVINTNATAATVTPSGQSATTISTIHNNCFWVSFSAGVTSISVALSGAPADVEVGIVQAGSVYSFADPEYGLSQTLQDFSIKKQLNSGAMYYKQRDIVREFSGSISEERDTDFFSFMENIAWKYGSTPMPWLISTNLESDNQWCIYASLEMPSGNHEYFSHSKISFKFIEFI